MDWSDGEYEHTAAELLPASERVVAIAEEERGAIAGADVLDLGCGTGNAAITAARRGARVVAVDPAARLVEVTRARAAADGLTVDARVGDASRIPLADRSVDVVTSVFAVIFAPDADAAAREMMRVLRDDGLVVLTSWTSSGAIADVSGILRQAMGAIAPSPPAGPPARWDDAGWVSDLFARHGARSEVTTEALAFEAPSAKEWLDRQVTLHPIWRTMKRALEAAGWDAVYARMLARLEQGDATTASAPGWRVTSHYRIVRARRSGT